MSFLIREMAEDFGQREDVSSVNFKFLETWTERDLKVL